MISIDKRPSINDFIGRGGRMSGQEFLNDIFCFPLIHLYREIKGKVFGSLGGVVKSDLITDGHSRIPLNL